MILTTAVKKGQYDRIRLVRREHTASGKVVPSDILGGQALLAAEPGAPERVSPGMRRIAVLAAMAALGLAACGGSDSESSATPAATEAATDAAHRGARRRPPADRLPSSRSPPIPAARRSSPRSTLTAKAGRVEVDFSNQSQLPHAVSIEGNGVDEKTETVTGQDAPPLTVDLKPGTYTFYCPVGDHRAAGMEGTITVK